MQSSRATARARAHLQAPGVVLVVQVVEPLVVLHDQEYSIVGSAGYATRHCSVTMVLQLCGCYRLTALLGLITGLHHMTKVDQPAATAPAAYTRARDPRWRHWPPPAGAPHTGSSARAHHRCLLRSADGQTSTLDSSRLCRSTCLARLSRIAGYHCCCCHATHAVAVTVLDGGFSDTAVYSAACAVTFAVPQSCYTPPMRSPKRRTPAHCCCCRRRCAGRRR